MGQPLIKVQDLCVSYQAGDGQLRNAVRDANFSVEEGAVLAITGESGAGKSSLALALAALHDATSTKVSGQLNFAGRDLLLLDEKELCAIRGREIGFIFQDPAGSLDPSMPVLKQVAEALTAHGAANKDEAIVTAHSLLNDVGFDDELLATAPFSYQLSGGLCQRAIIAAALAMSPRLLIADEPTSSLDPTVQKQIIDLLKARQSAGGMTMVFISHDLALVSKIADYVLVMNGGEIVEYGETRRVMESPNHFLTRELISAWDLTGMPRGGHLGSA